MLIIGHRGAAGIKPENTLQSLRAAMAVDVDMVEFDVRLTKDNIPVLAHDFHLYRTHRSAKMISAMTLSELQAQTGESEYKITTLDEALGECFGKVLLGIELKQSRSFQYVLPVIQKYIKQKEDWKSIIFLSFRVKSLVQVQKLAPEAQLALTHTLNPFTFLRHVRDLKLIAVGFHRLHANTLAIEIAQRLGLFTYAYTVNRPEAALRLLKRGIDGIITNRPDIMAADKRLKDL